MEKFKEIDVLSLNANPFRMIGKDWMLVTAKKGDKVNTMTASWGGMGVLWGKNVAYVVIRPQRYTKEFIDSSECFSLTFFDDSFKKELGYLGRVSGRDEDKIKNSGLTLAENENIPYFTEAKTVLLARKMYADELKADKFIDTSVLTEWYPANDLHTLYIAEITKCLIKDDECEK